MAQDRDEIDAACAVLRGVLERTRGMHRREFLASLAAAASGSALLSSLAGVTAAHAQSTGQPVTAFVFGGTWKRGFKAAFADPFTARTGIPVQTQEPYTFARVRAMHEAKAQQIDVFSADGAEVIIGNRAKMFVPIDFGIVDRSQLSEQQLKFPNVVGGYMLSMVICYSRKKWPGDHRPKSWADFWDIERFPGRRAIRRTPPMWTIEAALKADGAKAEGLYPLDLDRAFRSLERIRPHVKAWWTDNAQAQQLMEQEEVDLITMMNGRATESIVNSKAPYEIEWNEGITGGPTQGWVVPVGSPNPKGGMKLIDFMTRPEPQAAFARAMYYAPQNLKAFDFLEPEVARQMPSYPPNYQRAHVMNIEWWADNYTQVQRRMERWLQS